MSLDLNLDRIQYRTEQRVKHLEYRLHLLVEKGAKGKQVQNIRIELRGAEKRLALVRQKSRGGGE